MRQLNNSDPEPLLPPEARESEEPKLKSEKDKVQEEHYKKIEELDERMEQAGILPERSFNEFDLMDRHYADETDGPLYPPGVIK